MACLARGANPVPLFIPRVLGLHLLPAACARGPRKSLARWNVEVLHITKRVLGLHSLPAAFVRGPRVSLAV